MEMSHSEKIHESKRLHKSGLHRCGSCGIIKEMNAENFVAKLSSTTGFSGTCKICQKAKIDKHKLTYHGFLSSSLGMIRNRTGKKQGHAIDFDTNYLMKLLREQKYRCYFSGVRFKLETNKRSPYKPSVDRLDPDGPYTKDNIVLSCQFINYARNNTNEKDTIEFLKDLRQSLLNKDLHNM